MSSLDSGGMADFAAEDFQAAAGDPFDDAFFVFAAETGGAGLEVLLGHGLSSAMTSSARTRLIS